MPRLRITSITAIISLCILTFIFFSSRLNEVEVPAEKLPGGAKPASTFGASTFSAKLPSFDVPKFQFSFKTSAHKPPEQHDSHVGDTRWYSDWKWLNPFSGSITLEEDRAVLPPLKQRTPIYTYYDTTKKRDKESKAIDQEILLTWRRAWWAFGFRPVVLVPGDAQKNPLYTSLQMRKLEPALEHEFSRFLAWGYMGAGLLASYHCLPMGAYHDDLLVYLRRGEFPQLTRFENLGTGLFASPKSLMNDAVEDALEHADLSKVSGIVEAIPAQRFRVEPPSSLAHYDSATITAKYPTLATRLVTTPNEGRRLLIELINSHLHLTWQNSFRKGLVVLKPLPKHTTALVEPSAQLAELLAQCPTSMIPSSCPPNNAKCSPCVANRVSITTRAAYRNTSDEFSIGTVPHPYTLTMLNNQSDHITLGHIRRYTPRDPWLTELTKELLGTGRGGPSRVVGLKDAVASEYAQNRALWLNVEQMPVSASAGASDTKKKHSLPDNFLLDLDWYFGFSIPRSLTSKGESETPVPGPERRPKSQPGLPVPVRKSWDVDPPDDKDLALELELLQTARDVIKSGDRGSGHIKTIVELWNLADTEAWRFIRAWRARSTLERGNWEDEEKKFGVDRSGKGSSRWFE